MFWDGEEKREKNGRRCLYRNYRREVLLSISDESIIRKEVGMETARVCHKGSFSIKGTSHEVAPR